MKVLAVLDALNFGGAENLLSTLARVGPRHDLELSVVSLASANGDTATWLPALQRAGLEPRFLDITRLAQPDAIRRVARAIRESGCDVVHAHLEDAATLAPLAGRLTRTPCVSTYHHVPRPLQGRERIREWLSVQAANRGKRVLFVSHASRDGFAARYRPRPNWSVLHNGIDLTEFRPTPTATLPADLGIPAGAPVVTVVGRLGDGKGHSYLLDAWPAVLRRVPEARLLLVGDGPYEPALRLQAGRLQLRDRVVFAGRRADVGALLAASSVACLPTRREALPTALIEAAACGVPAVASGVTGVLEVVDDGVTGRLVPYAAPEALAAALGDLLADPATRAAMGAAARRLAEQRFDAEVWAARLHDVYAEAIGARR
jgi:glycosyltransferase involved in cell wall biosynthesis